MKQKGFPLASNFIRFSSVSVNAGQGFTLIELLVVIAIIGLLASILLVALNNARSSARDAKRRADLKQIATALDLYYTQQNPSTYIIPNTGYNAGGRGWIDYSGATCVSSYCPTTIGQGLVNVGLMAKPPLDPSGKTDAGGYYLEPLTGDTTNFNKGYCLVATLENPTDQETVDFNSVVNSNVCNGGSGFAGFGLNYVIFHK